MLDLSSYIKRNHEHFLSHWEKDDKVQHSFIKRGPCQDNPVASFDWQADLQISACDGEAAVPSGNLFSGKSFL